MSATDASGLAGKTSICYVVPFYAPGDDQHFAHLPRLLSRIATRCDLHVIVERGDAPRIVDARTVQVQSSSRAGRFRRYAEFLSFVWKVRRMGCRRFFVRISRGAALVLIAVRPILRLELYYWNSGQVRWGWPRQRTWLTGLRFWADDRLLRFIVRRADRLVTGPESMVNYYVQTYGVAPSRCITLYNDVDTSLYRPLKASERPVVREKLGLPDGPCVLFVGRVSRYKGGEFILPLEAALTRHGAANAYLTVVGPIHIGRLVPALEQAPRVILCGSKANDEVPQYMQVADVLVLPSLSEGFPRVLIEAMACGLPVVAFDIGGVRDILGPLQQEFIIAREDIDALAAGAATILADAALARRLRAENLDHVRRFATERVAEMFVHRIVTA